MFSFSVFSPEVRWKADVEISEGQSYTICWRRKQCHDHPISAWCEVFVTTPSRDTRAASVWMDETKLETQKRTSKGRTEGFYSRGLKAPGTYGRSSLVALGSVRLEIRRAQGEISIEWVKDSKYPDRPATEVVDIDLFDDPAEAKGPWAVFCFDFQNVLEDSSDGDVHDLVSNSPTSDTDRHSEYNPEEDEIDAETASSVSVPLARLFPTRSNLGSSPVKSKREMSSLTPDLPEEVSSEDEMDCEMKELHKELDLVKEEEKKLKAAYNQKLKEELLFRKAHNEELRWQISRKSKKRCIELSR